MKLQHLFPKCFSAFLVLSANRKRILFAKVIVTFFVCFQLNGQNNSPKITATGTGNTTGHIATLTVTNTGPSPIHLNPQTVYIPSGGAYQPYVASVPGTTLPPGGTKSIPVSGYCADVHAPPVPGGSEMPPITKWIPVGNPGMPVSEGTINIIPGTSKPSFSSDDIPAITNSPGYNPNPPGSEGEIITTWPGTDVPVGGTIDPNHYPGDFAPLIVGILQHIEDAADIILQNDDYPTPFANDPEKERESVIQQTLWMCMADITGEEYKKDDFTEKVYDQFQTSTGNDVISLPEEQKKKVDDGIADFWNVFTAVGAEAKVLSSVQAQIFPKTDKDKIEEDIERAKRAEKDKAKAQQDKNTAEPPKPREPMAPAVDTDCVCDSLSYKLTVRRENPKDATRNTGLHEDAAVQSLKDPNTIRKISFKDWKQGDYYNISVTDIVMHCHCQNKNSGNVSCDFYAASPISTEKGKVLLKEDPKTKQGEAKNLKDVETKDSLKKASRKDSDFKYKFTPKADKKNKGEIEISFCFSSVCSSDDCALENNKAKCEYCLTLSFIK